MKQTYSAEERALLNDARDLFVTLASALQHYSIRAFNISEKIHNELSKMSDSSGNHINTEPA